MNTINTIDEILVKVYASLPGPYGNEEFNHYERPELKADIEAYCKERERQKLKWLAHFDRTPMANGESELTQALDKELGEDI